MSRLIAALMTVTLAVSVPVIAQADPIRWAMEGWKTDFEQSSVPLARVLSGGPPRDGIPSIDNPVFEFATGASDLAETDPVVTVKLGDDARAYPLRILTWHEIVNDVVDGQPIAVTYCPLCNSAPVFSRKIGDRVLEFGTTGKLQDSNLIMYDRQTETWWQQFTGEAIVGELLSERLELVPARLESWADFKAANPAGRVLVPNNEGMRDYGRNPYVGYDSSRPFLYDGQLPEDIDPMERVVIVPRPDATSEPIIVLMKEISVDGSLDVSGHSFSWRPGRNSALDSARIAKGRDVGTVLVTHGGKDVPYDITFAFVAHAFHPDVAMIGK